MNEEAKTQAVVDEANAPAKPAAAAVDDAREADIDTLLQEFEQGTKVVSPPEPKPTAPTEAEPSWAREIRERFIQEDIKKVTSEIFDGLDVSDRLKSAWVDQIAREKPGVARAFLNRSNDPATWNKIVRSLKPEAQRDFPGAKKVAIDSAATADREAVAAAVRGASTRAPAEPPPDLGRMTNREYAEYTRRNFGF